MTIDIVGVGAAGLYSINDEGAGLIALRPTSKGVGWFVLFGWACLAVVYRLTHR